jgi:hypothetical protein
MKQYRFGGPTNGRPKKPEKVIGRAPIIAV